MKIQRHQQSIPNYGKNWDDLPPVPVIVGRPGIGNNPSLATFQGNIQQYIFAVNDYIYGAQEFTHSYKEGTDISAHVHWATNGTDVNDRTVKWELEYSISNAVANGGPFTELFPTPTVISSEITIPASTGDRAHILLSLGTITGTGILIGSYITYRFRRIASSGTEPSSDPFGLAVGFHVEQNTLGSRQIGTK